MQDFFANYWQIIFTPLSIVIAYFFGGKQKQKTELKKSDAEAQQEETKAKKDLADLERDIYTRLIETVNNELGQRDTKIKHLEDTQKDLLKTIEIQTGNIEHLQKTVDDYKQTCDDCQFRITKKVGKAVGK
jgi:predicted  nucleic acid-binding Zn-ribbon protein